MHFHSQSCFLRPIRRLKVLWMALRTHAPRLDERVQPDTPVRCFFPANRSGAASVNLVDGPSAERTYDECGRGNPGP
jgi:hypothetical protein